MLMYYRGLDVPDADLEIKPKENGRIHVVSMVNSFLLTLLIKLHGVIMSSCFILC